MIGRSLSLQNTGAPVNNGPSGYPSQQLPAHLVATAAISSRPVRLLSSVLGWLLSHRFHFRWTLRFWRELAAISLLVMSLTWTVPWFRSLSKATNALSAGQVFMIFFGLGMASFFSIRLFNRLRIRSGLRRWWLLGMLLLAVMTGLKTLLYAKEVVPLTALVMKPLWAFTNFSALIPNEIIVIAAVLLIWRRGAVLSLAYIGSQRVLSEFKTAFWMFLLFTMINTLVTTESIDFAFMGAYVLSGLVAMGAARMSAVGELRGGRQAGFDRQRLVAVLAGAILSALLAYWIGFNFAKDGAVMAGMVVGAAVLSAFIVSIPVLLVFLYLLYGGVSLFENEISIAMSKLILAIEGILAMLDQMKAWLQIAGEFLADRLAFLAPIFRWLISQTPIVRNIVLAAVLLLIAGAVYLVLYLRAGRLRTAGLESPETVLGIGDLFAALRRRLLKQLMEQQAAMADMLDFRARYRRQLANRIRNVYAALMELAEDMGTPRKDAQTPIEFQYSFSRVLPEEAAALARITASYLRVRYGEFPEDLREAQAVENALKSIRKAAARKKPGKTV